MISLQVMMILILEDLLVDNTKAKEPMDLLSGNQSENIPMKALLTIYPKDQTKD